MAKKKKEDKERWLSYTNPEYIQENARWEFYQKDQDNLTLEIYHSIDEEEIREIHRKKVMDHIMASMKEESKNTSITNPQLPEESKEPVKQKNTIATREGLKKIKSRKESSSLIHISIVNKIYEMRLRGCAEKEIYAEVHKEFNISFMTVGLYLSKVIDRIREESKGIVEGTIKDHLEKYEALYKWFNETGYSRAALKALEKKEKLLGLYDNEDENLKLLNGLIDENGVKKLYLWETLSESERYRLIQLAKKTVKIIKPDKEDEQSIS